MPKIIHCSIVQSATNPDARNFKAKTPPASKPQLHIKSHNDNDIQGDEVQLDRMPIIDPEELVGRALSNTQEDGETTRTKVIEAIKDHHDSNSGHKPTLKLDCSVNSDTCKEVLSYNQVMEYLAKDDNEIAWKFKEIIDHQGPLLSTHKDYKGYMYNLTIL